MTRVQLQSAALTALLLAVGAGLAAAQSPPRDTDSLRVGRGDVAVIDTPTVIVLVRATRSWVPDSVLKRARTVAAGLGYAFQLHAAGELRRLIDRRHAAIYHVRGNVPIGYLIIAPGRRPRTVERLVDARSLAHEIGQYELLVHHLTLARPPLWECAA